MDFEHSAQSRGERLISSIRSLAALGPARPAAAGPGVPLPLRPGHPLAAGGLRPLCPAARRPVLGLRPDRAALAPRRPRPGPRRVHRPLLPHPRRRRRVDGPLRLPAARRRPALAVARLPGYGAGGARRLSGRGPGLGGGPLLRLAGGRRLPGAPRRPAHRRLRLPAAAQPRDAEDRRLAPRSPPGRRRPARPPPRPRRRHPRSPPRPARLGGGRRALALPGAVVRSGRRGGRTPGALPGGPPRRAPGARRPRRGQLPVQRRRRDLAQRGGRGGTLAGRSPGADPAPPLRHRPGGLLAGAGRDHPGAPLRPRPPRPRTGPPRPRRDRSPARRRRARPVLPDPPAADRRGDRRAGAPGLRPARRHAPVAHRHGPPAPGPVRTAGEGPAVGPGPAPGDPAADRRRPARPPLLHRGAEADAGGARRPGRPPDPPGGASPTG